MVMNFIFISQQIQWNHNDTGVCVSSVFHSLNSTTVIKNTYGFLRPPFFPFEILLFFPTAMI